MRTSSRALAIFGAAIGLLTLVALIMVLVTSGRPVELRPEDTPEGVVQRYMMAIDKGEYLTAWSYLEPPYVEKPQTFEDWSRSLSFQGARAAYKATLGPTKISGSFATVEIIIDTFRQSSGLFDNPVNTNRVVFSLRWNGSAWKITDPVYIWWIY